jgi:hypothetical protein
VVQIIPETSSSSSSSSSTRVDTLSARTLHQLSTPCMPHAAHLISRLRPPAEDTVWCQTRTHKKH